MLLMGFGPKMSKPIGKKDSLNMLRYELEFFM